MATRSTEQLVFVLLTFLVKNAIDRQCTAWKVNSTRAAKRFLRITTGSLTKDCVRSLTIFGGLPSVGLLQSTYN